MKVLPLILTFFLMTPVSGQEIECAPSAATPLQETQKKNVELVLNISSSKLKELQKENNALEVAESKKFLAELSDEKRNHINKLVKLIKESKSSLIPLVETEGAPVLLVQGLDFQEFPFEWIKPFAHVTDKKQLSYFFKWSKFDSLEKNSDELKKVIQSLLEKHKKERLLIVGYSAGGVLTTHAMSKLRDDPAADRIDFHTISSPLYGYNAPIFALFGIPFAGKTAIEIGMGPFEKLKKKKFSNCYHWINLNCEKDMHACDMYKMKPFTGAVGTNRDMPCGNENVTEFDNEGHGSILNVVVQKIIP